jgi:hypothetical protein
MKRKQSGGPAFPRSGVKDGYGKVVGDVAGMDLRDWFAGQALAGILANPSRLDGVQNTVEGAYCLADAMIAERAK